MKIEARRDVKALAKWATIAFAWLCWAAALGFRNWWLVPLGVVPYLVWNQVGGRSFLGPKTKNGRGSFLIPGGILILIAGAVLGIVIRQPVASDGSASAVVWGLRIAVAAAVAMIVVGAVFNWLRVRNERHVQLGRDGSQK